MSPLLVPVYAVMIASPHSRYYLDVERTAVLAVAATKRSWLIQDHASAQPGSGAGKVLREKLLPTILSAADRHRIPIVLETSVPELETAYQRDIPGLHFVEDAHLGRKTYRRDPTPSAGAGE
ncbi:hypothetical protein [Brachybacterium sp. ACRRE]|nr:hypothetical protein [Brachybacterium sp. ACRRE]MCG7308055.1 hypothetical protein [Brachybacterium sp. ACRRE]